MSTEVWSPNTKDPAMGTKVLGLASMYLDLDRRTVPSSRLLGICGSKFSVDLGLASMDQGLGHLGTWT